MCARFTMATTQQELAELFGIANILNPLAPRYNIAPTQEVPIVRNNADERELVSMKWGLLPKWATDHTPAINAKAETVMEKPFFREAIHQRRCLIPADGFIEWETIAGKKQPNLFRWPKHPLFAFAGIWENDGFAILTVAANADLQAIHNRMPLMLAPEQFNDWFRGPNWETLMRPLPDGSLQSHQVSASINSPKLDTPELLKPIKATLFD